MHCSVCLRQRIRKKEQFPLISIDSKKRAVILYLVRRHTRISVFHVIGYACNIKTLRGDLHGLEENWADETTRRRRRSSLARMRARGKRLLTQPCFGMRMCRRAYFPVYGSSRYFIMRCSSSLAAMLSGWPFRFSIHIFLSGRGFSRVRR